jgi:hypothetical protein
MLLFSVFNYSSTTDVEIENYSNNFIEYLSCNGIREQFDIEFCCEDLKANFLEYIIDSHKRPIIDNEYFLLQLNDYRKMLL